MSSEKVELVKGLTVRALVVGVALSIFLTVAYVIGSYTISHHFSGYDYVVGSWDSPSIFNFFWPVGLWTILLLTLVTSPLPRRLRLTKQELTVILTMCIMTIALTTCWSEVAYGMATRSTMGGGAIWTVGGQDNILIKWYCFWWSRVDAYPVEPHLYVNGGWIGRPINVVLPCPLHLYAPAIIWHAAQMITLGLLCIFMAAILRRQFIDIESLPFPNATAASTLIIEATTEVEGKIKLFRDKWFWLGFALAQIMVIPGYIYVMGAIVGFDTTAFRIAATTTSWNLIIPYIPLAFCWFAPWILGLGVLMPTDFLISFFITWIVFIVIIANVEWMMGMFSPPPATATMGWYAGRINDYIIILNPPGIGLEGIAYGILIAAGIYPLWVHRSYVLTTLKALWRKPPAELEEKEALPYKWLWTGAILSFIGYLICYAITPAAEVLWLMIPFIIMNIIWWIGGARFVATAGGGMWSAARIGWGPHLNWAARAALFSLYGKPTVAGAISGRNLLYAHFVTGTHGYWTGRSAGSMPMPVVLDCFKIGSATGTRMRDILIASIIGLVIPVAIANPLRISMNYWCTWRVGPGQNSWASDDYALQYVLVGRGEPYGWRDCWYEAYPVGNPWPDVQGVSTLIIVGFIIGIVCFWLRARFTWFIYTPFSIWLWAYWTTNRGAEFLWFLLLIALIMRLIVIRTFGILFYEEKIVPLATGLFIGGMLYMTIDFAYYWQYGRVFV